MSQEEDGDDRKDICLKFWIYEYLTLVISECHTWVHAWVSCRNWIFVTEASYPPFWISRSIHTWTPFGFAIISCFRALAQFTHELNLTLPSSLVLDLLLNSHMNSIWLCHHLLLLDKDFYPKDVWWGILFWANSHHLAKRKRKNWKFWKFSLF